MVRRKRVAVVEEPVIDAPAAEFTAARRAFLAAELDLHQPRSLAASAVEDCFRAAHKPLGRTWLVDAARPD
jgi:hypothetical protein